MHSKNTGSQAGLRNSGTSLSLPALKRRGYWTEAFEKYKVSSAKAAPAFYLLLSVT